MCSNSAILGCVQFHNVVFGKGVDPLPTRLVRQAVEQTKLSRSGWHQVGEIESCHFMTVEKQRRTKSVYLTGNKGNISFVRYEGIRRMF